MTDKPLNYLIEIFGGSQALARALGIHPSNITRWQLPRSADRRGRDCRLPPDYNGALVEAADAAGISRETIAPYMDETVCPCCGSRLAPGTKINRRGVQGGGR